MDRRGAFTTQGCGPPGSLPYLGMWTAEAIGTEMSGVEASNGEKIKIVISDCHLSAGRFFEGRLNPHEDFKFDTEMCEFFEYFSTEKYGTGPDGPVEVELFINGDFLDFLNVPYHGEFEDAITEAVALFKLEA